MATYTINVTLNTGATPPITVDQESLAADFGTDTIYWVPASGQSGWDFVSIDFNPDDVFSDLTVNDQTIQVTDTNEAATTQTIAYTLYVEQNGTVYESDPYILNDPKT